MRTSVIQLAYGDSETMKSRVERVADLVEKQHDSDLIVLPELWAPGGFSYREWAERAQSVEGDIARSLAEAAANAGAWVHAGSIIEKSGEPGAQGRGLWNTSLLFSPDGELVETYRKIHRFGFGEGEPQLLEAGEEVVVADLAIRGESAGSRELAEHDGQAQNEQSYPESSDETGGEEAVAPPFSGVAHEGFEERTDAGAVTVKAGLSTCYDVRFPELYRLQVDAGAEVFIIPAAWPAARVFAWRSLLTARAIENQVFVIACNTAGTHAGVEMGGNSVILSPMGEVLAEAGRGERVINADIDVAEVAKLRASFPVLADRRL